MTPVVSLSDVYLAEDFGTIKRPGLHSMIYKSEVYRAALKGSALLHLTAVGTYWIEGPHMNILDEEVFTEGLEGPHSILNSRAYQLELSERQRRASLVPELIADLDTASAATLNMVSYRPPIVAAAICEGAALPLRYSIKKSENEGAAVNFDALLAGVRSHADVIQGTVYIGWDTGYSPVERKKFLNSLEAHKSEFPEGIEVVVDESRIILKKIAEDLRKPESGRYFG